MTHTIGPSESVMWHLDVSKRIVDGIIRIYFCIWNQIGTESEPNLIRQSFCEIVIQIVSFFNFKRLLIEAHRR